MAELTAVALAGNILQFLELGTKVFIRAKELYNSASGATAENERSEEAALELQRLSKLVGTSSSASESSLPASTSSIERQRRKFARDCEETCGQLMGLLAEQKVEARGGDSAGPTWRTLKSFKLSIGHTRARDKIVAVEKRLEQLHDRLFQCLMLDIRNQQSTFLAIVQELKSRSEALDAKTTSALEAFEGLIRDGVSENRQSRLQANAYSKLTKNLNSLSQEARNVTQQQGILRSLYFRTIRQRRIAIKDHHSATFQWAFDDKTSTFSRWLQSGSGIFWIEGKAGSGKSTLMKFLASHPSCKERLVKWAGTSRLIMAHHFFWNYGNVMQKSRLGLLQTLIFQVLKECPRLIETVCPSRWGADSTSGYAEPWTEHELYSVLDNLATQKDLPLKFCFFIDGLDEYTDGMKRYRGTFTELIDALKHLASSPFIKVCASSRPWPAFKTNFGYGDWQLKLEELTKHDIKQYVDDELGKSPGFKRMSRQDARCNQIAPYIVEKAQGVFLWVFLVVEEIKKGLSQYDSYNILKKRLNNLPPDLNDYFGHMLDSIEPVYWEETSKIFQVMISANQALPLLSFDFLGQEMDDPRYALGLDDSLYDIESLQSIYERENVRINARCLDLLYISSCIEPSETLVGFKVDFLHRTVRDFFAEGDVLARLRGDSTTHSFGPLMSLCRIQLALSKILPFQHPDDPDLNQVFTFADGLMYYALQIEDLADSNTVDIKPEPCHHPQAVNVCDAPRLAYQSCLQDMFELLDDLDRSNNERISRQLGFHWTNAKDPPKGIFQEYRQKTFIAAAIQARLSMYVTERLNAETNKHLIQKRGRPLIDYALRPTMVTPLQISNQEEGPIGNIIEVLLTHGADPNRSIYVYDGRTPWELFLGACHRYANEKGEVDITTDLANVMVLLVRQGANTEVRVQVMKGDPKGVGILDVAERLQLPADYISELKGAIRDKELQRANNSSIASRLTSWIFGSN